MWWNQFWKFYERVYFSAYLQCLPKQNSYRSPSLYRFYYWTMDVAFSKKAGWKIHSILDKMIHRAMKINVLLIFIFIFISWAAINCIAIVRFSLLSEWDTTIYQFILVVASIDDYYYFSHRETIQVDYRKICLPCANHELFPPNTFHFKKQAEQWASWQEKCRAAAARENIFAARCLRAACFATVRSGRWHLDISMWLVTRHSLCCCFTYWLSQLISFSVWFKNDCFCVAKPNRAHSFPSFLVPICMCVSGIEHAQCIKYAWKILSKASAKN